MLFFSQRRSLAMIFDEWRTKSEDGVVAASCPENVITFLCSAGLVNEEKVKEYLETHKPKVKRGR